MIVYAKYTKLDSVWPTVIENSDLVTSIKKSIQEDKIISHVELCTSVQICEPFFLEDL